MAKEQIIYTTVFHENRIKLNLTFLEYCLADMIYHLSNNPRNKISGWCTASKEYLSTILGVSKQGLHKALHKLIECGLIEKHDNRRFLKTTQKWYDVIIVNKVDIDKNIVNKVDIDSKQSLPYNNIYNNTSNTKVLDKQFDFTKTLEKLIESKTEYTTIIGCYWKHKGITFPNQTAYQSAYKRNIKPAKVLCGYSDKDLWDTFEYLDKQDFKWTLETVFKYIPEIKKLKK